MNASKMSLSLSSVHSRLKSLFDEVEIRMTTEEKRAEEELETQFARVEVILDKTFLPSIIPRIKYALQSRLDLATRLEVIRAPCDVSTSPQQKLEAWEDLKVLSFSRAAATSLSLVIVSLQMRIMLNVLSRQLYLENALHDTLGDVGLRTLSFEVQETFLGLVEKGFALAGVGKLVLAVKQVVRSKVAGIQLSKSLSAAELQELLEAIRDDILPTIIRGNLGAGEDRPSLEHSLFPLFPHDNLIVKQVMTRARTARNNCECDGTPVHLHDLHPEHGKLVQMVQEVRETVQSQRFRETITVALNKAWEEMTVKAVKGLYGDSKDRSVAFAKLIPAMSNLSGELLADPGKLWSAVAECQVVQSFTREMW